MNRTGNMIQGKPYLFQGALAANTSAVYEKELFQSGTISNLHIKFAAGENGTLHIRPMVIQNGEIPIDLINYEENLNQYVSGDDEHFDFKCFMPVENGTKIRLVCDNTGAYASFIDVAIVVDYIDNVREYSVIK